MSSFEDLQLPTEEITQQVKINDTLILEVRKYLPIKEKEAVLDFVINNALDQTTGCFSPLRVNVYFALAICQWYGGIDINMEDVSHVYDALEMNGVVDLIRNAIPQDEIDFMEDLVEDTIADISRYNSSAAGIINNMSDSAENLDEQLNNILDKIKSDDATKAMGKVLDVVKNG